MQCSTQYIIIIIIIIHNNNYDIPIDFIFAWFRERYFITSFALYEIKYMYMCFEI